MNGTNNNSGINGETIYTGTYGVYIYSGINYTNI
jgi:hypothetical protein